MIYGETNLKQYMASFLADNVRKANEELIWFLMENRDIQIEKCEYDEGTRWTALRLFYLKEDKGGEEYGNN
jgi:hypothetical protein